VIVNRRKVTAHGRYYPEEEVGNRESQKKSSKPESSGPFLPGQRGSQPRTDDWRKGQPESPAGNAEEQRAAQNREEESVGKKRKGLVLRESSTEK